MGNSSMAVKRTLVIALTGMLWCIAGGLRATSPNPPTIASESAGGAEIEPAIQKVYPALVRIYVVVEEPSDGRM